MAIVLKIGFYLIDQVSQRRYFRQPRQAFVAAYHPRGRDPRGVCDRRAENGRCAFRCFQKRRIG